MGDLQVIGPGLGRTGPCRSRGRATLLHWFRGLDGPAGDGEANGRLLWQAMFNGRFEDRDHAIALYRRHTANMVNMVNGLDPERLLVFEVADGWAPRCRFLGVPEPDAPVPHVNDAAWMRRRISAVRDGTRALQVAGLAVAALARHRTRASRHTRG